MVDGAFMIIYDRNSRNYYLKPSADDIFLPHQLRSAIEKFVA